MDIWQYAIPAGLGALTVYVGYYVKSCVDRKNQNEIDKLQADRNLLSSALDVLSPDSASIDFVKNHDFWCKYKQEQIEPLRAFMYSFQDSDKFFHDTHLNKCFRSLVNSVNEFFARMGELSTFGPGEWYTCVKPSCDPDHDIPPKVKSEIDSIVLLADKVARNYEQFVVQGKKRLKV